MTYKPTLCLDFDGVIHSYQQPWINAQTIPDAPVDGAFDFIHAAMLAGFKVAIYSSRSHEPGGIDAMKDWFRHHTPAHRTGLIAGVEWPTHKPAAFVTLDDRAITFDGSWPDVHALKRFKPWNK